MSKENSFNISPTTYFQDEAKLYGTLTVGENNYIQVRSKLIAENGPIIMGSNNILEENVMIINKSSEPMYIGNDNYFEAYSYVESSSIGNRNHIEAKARILSGTLIKDNTVVGALCYTEPGTVLKDKEVIFGDGNTRREQFSQNFLNYHPQHCKFMKKILSAPKSKK